jgi:hypothetical protein
MVLENHKEKFNNIKAMPTEKWLHYCIDAEQGLKV